MPTSVILATFAMSFDLSYSCITPLIIFLVPFISIEISDFFPSLEAFNKN